MKIKIHQSVQANIVLQVAVILFTMLNNLEHGAELYFKLTVPGVLPQWVYKVMPYFVIVTLDMVIFTYMLQGDHKTAKLFAWGMFVINLLYWDIFGTLVEIGSALLVNDVHRFTLAFTKLLVSVIFAGAFSYSIHAFSKSLKKSIDFSQHLRRFAKVYRMSRDKCTQLYGQVQQAEGLAANHKLQLSKVQADLTEANRKYSEQSAELATYQSKEEKETAALTCTECNHLFPDRQTMGKQRGGKERTKCKSGACGKKQS